MPPEVRDHAVPPFAMKRPLLLAAAVLLAAALGWVVWMLGPNPAVPADPDVSVTSDRAAVVERMKAARRSGNFDRVPARVRGRVVRDTDGTGIADAIVMIRPAVTTYGGVGEAVVVTTTDASGDWAAEDLEPGPYAVSASAPEHLPASVTDVELQAGTETANVEVGLQVGGRRVAGRITDHLGTPLPGVRVEATRLIDQQNAFVRVLPALTRDDGTFALWLADDQYHFAFHHPDYVPRTEFFAVTRARDDLQVRMAPGAVLRGRVLTRTDGTPVPHAEVRIHEPSGFMSGQGTATAPPGTRADGEGRYELRGLPSGAISVVASAPGFGTVDPSNVAVGVGEVRESFDVLVDRGFTVSGFAVSDRDQTRGLPGVTVTATNFADFSGSRLGRPSADDGYFEIHGLAPGEYMLMTTGDGIVPSMGGTSVSITDRDVDDALVRLDEGAYIEGRATPASAGSVQAWVEIDGSRVSVLQMGKLMSAMMSTMRVRPLDAEGRFRYGPVSPGTYTLEIANEHGLRGGTTVEVDEGTVSGVEVRLSSGFTVSGRVVDPQGAPVVGVTFSMQRRDRNPSLNLAGYTGSGALIDVTDEDGRFAVSGLSAGDYGYALRTGRMLRIPWADPEDPTRPMRPRTLDGLDGDRQLELVVPRAAPIRGTVRDPTGRPMAGVWVEAWPRLTDDQWLEAVDSGSMGGVNAAAGQQQQRVPDSLSQSIFRQMGRVYRTAPVLTDADGNFEILDERMPGYVVSGIADRGNLRGEADASLDEPVTLALQPQSTIVVGLAGDRAPGGAFRIALEGPDVVAQLARADQREVVMPRLRPGSYRVVVEAPEGVAARTLELAPGAEVTLPVELHAWSGVRGRVVDPAGRPVTGLAVLVDRRYSSLTEVLGGAQEMMGAMLGKSERRVQSDGTFEIGRLPPGPVSLRFLELPQLSLRQVLRIDLGTAEVREVGDVVAPNLALLPPTERGTLGLQLEVDDRPPDPPRLLVQTVASRGPAADAGLRPGDVVLGLAGLDPGTAPPEILELALRHQRPGTRLELRIERGGAPLDLPLVTGPAPRE